MMSSWSIIPSRAICVHLTNEQRSFSRSTGNRRRTVRWMDDDDGKTTPTRTRQPLRSTISFASFVRHALHRRGPTLLSSENRPRKAREDS